MKAMISSGGKLHVVAQQDFYPEFRDEALVIMSCQMPGCSEKHESVLSNLPIKDFHPTGTTLTLTQSGNPALLIKENNSPYNFYWVACKSPLCSDYSVTALPKKERSDKWSIISSSESRPVLAYTSSEADMQVHQCKDEACSERNRVTISGSSEYFGFEPLETNKGGNPIFFLSHYERDIQGVATCKSPSCADVDVKWLGTCVFKIAGAVRGGYAGWGCGKRSREVQYISSASADAPVVKRINLSLQSLKTATSTSSKFIYVGDAGTEDESDLRHIVCEDVLCTSIISNRPMKSLCDNCYPGLAVMATAPNGDLYAIWGGLDDGGMFVKKVE